MPGMALNLHWRGQPSSPVPREWSSKDALLYALAVGAGAEDPAAELAFTTENSAGVTQQVLPTFGCLLAAARSPRTLGDFDVAKLVHAEQSVQFHSPLQTAGRVEAVSTLVAAHDKGSAALLVQENVARDCTSGQALVTSTASFFIRGEGGFGGDRGPRQPEWAPPREQPDAVVGYRTRRDQPLLYRLTGDRNPLHSDPTVAQRAGLRRPILHGMCTFGFTGRALLHTIAGSAPERLLSMSARFTKPVYPGAELTVRIWTQDGQAHFQTVTDDGSVVLDRGIAGYVAA